MGKSSPVCFKASNSPLLFGVVGAALGAGALFWVMALAVGAGSLEARRV